MTVSLVGAQAHIKELPPYKALLVVDIKDFSGYPGARHAALTREVPSLLDQAFQRAGWRDWSRFTPFETSTGDGYVLVTESAVLPFLVHPFLECLQQELEDRNRTYPGGGDRPLRLRVSVHVGPVTDSGDGRFDDGSGDARVTLHRLLDAEPVRHLLDDSNPSTTLVAAVLSARVFEDVVVAEYCHLRSDDFVPVPVTQKSYSGQAYLRVPRPSGGLLRRGFPRPDDQSGPSSPASSGPQPTTSGPAATARPHASARGPVNAGSGSQNVIEDVHARTAYGAGRDLHIGASERDDRSGYPFAGHPDD